jgi:hypothetical protein
MEGNLWKSADIRSECSYPGNAPEFPLIIDIEPSNHRVEAKVVVSLLKGEL